MSSPALPRCEFQACARTIHRLTTCNIQTNQYNSNHRRHTTQPACHYIAPLLHMRVPALAHIRVFPIGFYFFFLK